MINPTSRFAGLVAAASLALAMLVGTINTAQMGGHVAAAPTMAVPAFSVVTPAVWSLT